MTKAPGTSPHWCWQWEWVVVTLLAWAALLCIPLGLGYIGLSYDALNHHIYLGWAAQSPRFDLDFNAASSQSYQVPYTYWPVYKLAMSGFSGVAAGVVLAGLACLSVPAVWLMARQFMPGFTWFDVFMRSAAVVLAFLSVVVLSLFGSTQNDVLAAVPLVWALALALQGVGAPATPNGLSRPWCSVVLAGLLAGVSVTFKLSNGPLVLVMPLIWLFHRGPFTNRLGHAVLGGVAMLVGCLVTFAPWGVQVWAEMGNPIYPLYGDVFEPFRKLLGWRP